MGASDGTVVGITKILDNGPNNTRHNIVLVAEGFTAAQQGDFNNLGDDFIDKLESEPWFAELGEAINVFRLNVESDQSGADDPIACGDGSPGSGATPNTFFDASFCNGGIRRCLVGNSTLVEDTLDAQLPEWHSASVLVNTSQRGGCAGNRVFWTAISDDWRDVVIHEFGHTSFNLADEYHYWEGCGSGETDRDNAPVGEPVQRNVTTETNRDQIKWKYFIHPTTPVPTMINPDCSQCDDRANVLSNDTTIGLYEGGQYFHCGRFRPAYKCKMRNSGQPFCRVCVDAIADVLANFIDEQPTVEVDPTLLEFGEVAHGLTLYRSFEVRNVKVGKPVGVDIDLADIVGDNVFGYAPGTERSFRLPAPVFESQTLKRVYISFTSDPVGVGDPLAVLQVQSPAIADGLPQPVTMTGIPIPPPPVDSVLVIDRSDSMSGDTGLAGVSKRDMAIEAAKLYVSLLKDTDRIGIVRYNHEARDPQDILLGMRVANDAGKNLAMASLVPANLVPDGFTSIGGGMILGSNVLDDGEANARAVVVLTDGIQNRSPDIPEAQGLITAKTPRQRVFSIGLGLNQLEDRLNQIATATNGTAQITGDLIDEREFLLQKLYVQILSDVSDEAFVKDPKRVALPGESQSTSVYLGEVDVSADFIIVFRKSSVFPKYLRTRLEAPDGTMIDPAVVLTMPNGSLSASDSHLYYRIQFPINPARPDGHVGRWKVWVENFSGRPIRLSHGVVTNGLPFYYSVMCKARSNFRLGGEIVQENYDPGSPMKAILRPTLYGLPVELETPVRVGVREILNLFGSSQYIELMRKPNGTYEGEFLDTLQQGPYLFTADVSARTPANVRITRHRSMTGIIFKPSGNGGSGGGNGGGNNVDKEILDQLRRCCKEINGRLTEIAKLLSNQKR